MTKVLVTRSSMPELEEYVNEIKNLFESHWLTNNGIKHRELENELCAYLNVKNIKLFCNGHMALYTALKALDLKGEVITTPFSFASTTHAIVQNGLTPVFCDINKDDYTIDVDKIESLITDKTCAIVPVHVYGNICDVDKIEAIAKRHNLKVIYDAAHAFGVKYKGESVLNYGDISMLSFHATKVFNTIEGGALVYNNSNYSDKLNQLKNFGIIDEENVDYVGMNCKMNEFQAAMGLCNLRHIDSEIAKRKLIVERYVENLKNIKGIKLNKIQENVISNYAYFPIVVEDEYELTRNDLFDLLAKNDICARKYFYPLINDYGCYNKKYNSDDTPIAKDIADRVITLPLYADLSLETVDQICNIINNVNNLEKSLKKIK